MVCLKAKKTIVLFLAAFLAIEMLFPSFALAVDPAPADLGSMASVCRNIADAKNEASKKYKPCANSPSDCGNDKDHFPPPNCLFLQEPIGGDPKNNDLYKVTVERNSGQSTTGSQTPMKLVYTLWHGGYIDKSKGEAGPVQAILTYEQGKEYQGPFGLLYNYVKLIYKFMSGIIVGFVVLISIIGGIRITVSQGAEDAQKGKQMIIKALVGMALWFLASLILYTINPTFFVF